MTKLLANSQLMAEHNKEKLRAKTQVIFFLSASSKPNLLKKMLHANLLDIPPKENTKGVKHPISTS